jgi:hypothetical protein
LDEGLTEQYAEPPTEENGWRWELQLVDETQADHFIRLTHKQYLELISHVAQMREGTEEPIL